MQVTCKECGTKHYYNEIKLPGGHDEETLNCQKCKGEIVIFQCRKCTSMYTLKYLELPDGTREEPKTFNVVFK